MENNLPLKHVSIRVPWHDNGWNGTVCNNPNFNGACLRLPRIATSRDDNHEQEYAGTTIENLPVEDWPCCVEERGSFMAPFDLTRTVTHPYYNSSKDTHGHFDITPLRYPQFSGAGVPFRWMLKNNMMDIAKQFGLNVNLEWEPKLNFNTAWVQDARNQTALLNGFFNQIQPETSLCFFYAKEVPFTEDSRRVIIGVGRVKHIGPITEYLYKSQGELRSVLWERMIQHSIRSDFKDGFLLPYPELMEYAANNPDFDIATAIAFAPNERITEFSYATELVTHDAAISTLLSCAAALNTIKKHIDGPWEQCIRWIDKQIADIWTLRGPCPGLGAALSAFGLELGTLIAANINQIAGENGDPWPIVSKVFNTPYKYLPSELASRFGSTLCKTWNQLPTERLALLKLLSRFEITPTQAKMMYIEEERGKFHASCSDREILENPYLLYELTRHQLDPISIWTVDKGVFPTSSIQEKHPLPKPSALDTGTDERRIRAIIVALLENSIAYGHTLLPRKDVILKIRELAIDPPCEINQDILTSSLNIFSNIIELVEMADGSPALKLQRLHIMGNLIQRTVTDRLKGVRHNINANWRRLLDDYLGKTNKADEILSQEDIKAREEKATILNELAQSRFSVLIGPAGTGKTTLLSVLCNHPEIAASGILLLAPTGKARVKMQQAASNLKVKAYTLAQYLSQCGRYDIRTQRYKITGSPGIETPKTVIVDEASMLTEEMLAALIESLKGVHRLILVGDPSQLPPIGAGRPFVDIVKTLAPDNLEYIFPRVSHGYGELTVRMRQHSHRFNENSARNDILLAEWFSGRPIGPGDDEIFNNISQSEHLSFVQWDTAEELREKLLNTLVTELGLSDVDDIVGFDTSLGATLANGYTYFNATKKDKPGAVRKIEDWQILSPVRNLPHGVNDLNRFIHQHFRSKTVDFANNHRLKRIPKPMGVEQIVYGDKVINVSNHQRKDVYPPNDALMYLANGEIGIITGQFRLNSANYTPWLLKVEFSSQQGYVYDFNRGDFSEESQPALELSYALSVHKAQGSEFETVIFVLPNPCRLLSRELLYTALTRQKKRVVILHQGNLFDLLKYSSLSETARRLTNLFEKPQPVEIAGVFLENRLIHKTSNGELVRSKSEVIIADHLANHGLTYYYEKPLIIDDIIKFPDFTIEDDNSGRIYYWEHCGMLQDKLYKKRWQDKLIWYNSNGITPIEEGGQLITSFDDTQGGINSQAIKDIIKKLTD